MRYFLFSYNHISSKGHGSGFTWFESEKFPSKSSIFESIIKGNNYDVKPENIVIIGWNEFKNKKDYESFCS